MISKRIVLLADRVETHYSATIRSRDLEVPCDTYFTEMYRAIKSIAPSVIHYESPTQFCRNLEQHTNDVVLSVWSGMESRSRRIFIPAICEANNIPYVGADAYLQAICQDKELSKLLCQQNNFLVPKGTLLYSQADYKKLKNFSYPLIIKPNFEGGSIGIFSDNVVFDYEHAIKIADSLIQTYRPLLAEEMISGEEISICIAGNTHIDIFEAIRQHINGKVSFTNEIMSAESKKLSDEHMSWDCVTNRISGSFRDHLIKFFRNLGKVDMIRIDGRWNEYGFFIIELTTDCGLSPDSIMTQAFATAGYTYPQMFEKLIHNSIIQWESQNASMK